MQLLSADNRVDSIPAAMVTHGDESLHFIMATYEKTTLHNPNLLFANVNAWLNTLSVEKQGYIFEAYKNIHEILSDNIDYIDVVDMMIKEVKELYDLINPEDASEWIIRNGVYTLPTDLRTSLSDKDTADLTYLRDDYYQVVGLAEVLRFMLPVWGAYIKGYEKVIGTEWKEFSALSLLGSSLIVDMPSYVRLCEYIEATLGKVQVNMAAIFAGLGSEDVVPYQTALAVVRKVVIGETSTDRVHIVKNVSNYVRSNMKGTQQDRKFVGEGRFVDKHQPSEKDSPDNTSIVESYKTKQEYPDSVPIGTEYSLNDYKVIARSVCEDIPMGLVEQCVRHSLRVKPDILTVRQQLAGLALAGPIEPEVLLALQPRPQWIAFGITMAIFAHIGEPAIAALMTAELRQKQLSLKDNSTLNIAISKEKYLELDPLYYNDLSPKTTVAARKQNPGWVTATEILNEFSNHQVIVLIPPKVADMDTTLINERPLSATYKLGSSLVNLIVKFCS